MGGPGLGGMGEPMVALGSGLPMTDQDEADLVDISDLPLQLKMGMRFSTWMRFETWFKRYCTETHQAFSTAYSRSVDYANHRMAQSSMRYRWTSVTRISCLLVFAPARSRSRRASRASAIALTTNTWRMCFT